MTHWHAVRHSEDEDPFITDSMTAVLDYAATELDQLADHEHDFVISIAVQVQDGEDPHPDTMADALKSLLKSERYNTLMINARNHSKNLDPDTPDDQRAPLYQDGDVNGLTAAERRDQGARRVISGIIGQSPLRIWECEHETGVYPEDDPERGGLIYCREYE